MAEETHTAQRTVMRVGGRARRNEFVGLQEEIQSMAEETHGAQRNTMRVGGAHRVTSNGFTSNELVGWQEEIQSMTEETHAAQRTTMRVGGASALPLLLGRLSRAAR